MKQRQEEPPSRGQQRQRPADPAQAAVDAARRSVGEAPRDTPRGPRRTLLRGWAAKRGLPALMVLLSTPAAGAQPVGSLSELGEQIGRNVLVITAPSGEVFAGQLIDISPGSLSMLAGGQRVDLDEMRVRSVRQDSDDTILDGAAIGALVGLLPRIVLEIIPTGSGHLNGSEFGFFVAMPTLVGAAIGALLDCSFTDRGRVLYQQSGRGTGVVALEISW